MSIDIIIKNNKTKKIVGLMLAVSICMLLLSGCKNADDKNRKSEVDEKQLAAIKTIRNATVIVEIDLQYDKGESPYAGGVDCEDLVQQERPVRMAGVLVSDTEAITLDPMIEKRFVKQIRVCTLDEKVDATIDSYLKEQGGAVLKFAGKLKGVTPLVFDVNAKDRLYVLSSQSDPNNPAKDWTFSGSKLAVSPILTLDSEKPYKYIGANDLFLVADADGKSVTLGARRKTIMPLDEKWKVAPADFLKISAADLRKLQDKLKAEFEKKIFRVALSFRSPRKDVNERMAARLAENDEEADKTERDTLGIAIGENRVLVLAKLSQKSTARLQRVRVYPSGKEIVAKFDKTLKNYGAFIVKTEKPLPAVQKFRKVDTNDVLYSLMLVAMPRVQGESVLTYYNHTRINSDELGWRDNIYPHIFSANESDSFVFDTDMNLIAMPMANRPEPGTEERWNRRRETSLTYAAQLSQIWADKFDDEDIDKSNVPLSEEDESRLAWLGVELQPMNQDLARINKVSEQTQDGSFGAIVSYIYPDSPAEKAGLELGDILLQLKVVDQPRPVKVEVGTYTFGSRPFPWNELDQVPEQYYEYIPTPWVPAENKFTRALTDIGFGRKFTLEYIHDGKVCHREFVVTQSPEHYGTAKKFKSKALGLTVKDMTFEVRRYFQVLPDQAGGVIISNIEPGSKASVAGLKPYEIITHVNDMPVSDVPQFKKLLKTTAGELKLGIKRMQKGRVVKIRMAVGQPNAAAKKTTAQQAQPTTQPANMEKSQIKKPAAPKNVTNKTVEQPAKSTVDTPAEKDISNK
ncbi:MAG TPA: PDZ domain-containing protein [Phycisphaerae bacterium]|nr:PDZ domain-containing protein [Phycisphaerae bacterium]HPS52274.1 PDZ domain-containing protein [Phycisphaerae bacterium]